MKHQTNFGNPAGTQTVYRGRLIDASNLADVTNQVIQSHIKPTEDRIICFGMGEISLTQIALATAAGPLIANLPLSGTPLNAEFTTYLDSIAIDLTGFLVITAKTCLKVTSSGELYALAAFTFRLFAQPGLNLLAFNDNFLQLTFDHALVTVDDAYAIDLGGLAQAGLGAPDAFANFVNDTLAMQIAQGPSGPYPTALPPVIQSFVLPDQWNSRSGYDILFQGFDFRTVTVGTSAVGYLFVVFSVMSQMKPPECVCPAAAFGDVSPPPQPPNPLLWSSAGFSKQALAELVRPSTDKSHDFTKSKGGAVYGTVNSASTTHLKNLDVIANGLYADVQGSGAGSLTAAARALGHDFARQSVGISIAIKNAYVLWTNVSVMTDPQDKTQIGINLQPLLKMDDPDVTLVSPLGPAFDTLASWFASVFVSALKDFLVASFDALSYLFLFYTMKVSVPPSRDTVVAFDFEQVVFVPKQSVIVIGDLSAQDPPG
jgi:hypothetical protein